MQEYEHTIIQVEGDKFLRGSVEKINSIHQQGCYHLSDAKLHNKRKGKQELKMLSFDSIMCYQVTIDVSHPSPPFLFVLYK